MGMQLRTQSDSVSTRQIDEYGQFMAEMRTGAQLIEMVPSELEFLLGDFDHSATIFVRFCFIKPGLAQSLR